jgi:cell division protein FtsB
MVSRVIFLQRALPIAVLVGATVAVPFMIFSADGLGRLRHLEAEKVRADEEVARLSEQIRKLRAEVRRIKDDPAMVERVARDELGLVRQTEVVFQFTP